MTKQIKERSVSKVKTEETSAKFVTSTVKILIIGLGILFAIFGAYITAKIEFERLKNTAVATIQNNSTALNTKFLKIEDAVNNLSYFITGSFDLKQVKNKNYLIRYNKVLNTVTKEFAQNTEGNISTYFYFDPELTGNVYGTWVVDKNQNKKFINYHMGYLSEFTPSNTNFSWYYEPINAHKAIWSDIYYDPDIKTSMISYVKPLYKDGKLLGVLGMDISMEGLHNTIKKLKSFNSEELILVNSKNKLLASSNSTSEILTPSLHSKYLGNLKKTSPTIITGIITTPDSNKVLVYSRLINNFVLLSNTAIPDLIEKSVIQALIILAITILLMIVLDMINTISTKESYNE